MTLLKITGGTVYDPLHSIRGEERNLWIESGKIVSPPKNRQPDREIDARGLVVMPGGVDMHCHIAGPKVTEARKLTVEEKRLAEPQPRRGDWGSGTLGSVPSSWTTGYHYAALGYTCAFDAAVPPLAARQVHQEFSQIPGIEKGFFTLVGNHRFLLECLKKKEYQVAQAFLGWLLHATGAYAPKVVNPGGVEVWKQCRRGNLSGLDEQVSGYDITPRTILREVARFGNQLNLPHPVHIHCNQLGVAGNWSTTLDSMKTLEGHRGHFAHIQFHSYGGEPDKETSLRSEVAPLVEYVNQHPEITVDVGQVMFGPTTSMTGDGPLGHFLSQVYGGPWISHDTEQECGCGIIPLEYKDRNFIHALQWAIGLEWYLLIENPWQVAMSTDHPNGGSFLTYPRLIRLLMDSAFREEFFDRIPKRVQKRCQLKDLKREYSLEEICIVTRAAPAKMLGLHQKGHLGEGADADITIYSPSQNPEEMFAVPRYVIQGGNFLVENYDLRIPRDPGVRSVRPTYDPGIEKRLAPWWAENYTVSFENYPLQKRERANLKEVDLATT
ncbi:Formylmethanofuran dehydrogenase subunit A [Planctomycetales bacterium 10988]|nr:Formylmethanofuran dehydrogenase subunit A [Planctomycetales bacterium 10988]